MNNCICYWAKQKYTDSNFAQNFGREGMSTVLWLDLHEKIIISIDLCVEQLNNNPNPFCFVSLNLAKHHYYIAR